MPDMNEHLEEGTIHSWLDGALAPDESMRVEAHAASCTSCSALVAEARGLVAASSRILSALDSIPAEVIPGRAGAVDSLLALRARRAEAVTRRWFRHPQFLAAASLILIAGTGTVVWRSLSRQPDSPLVTTELMRAADSSAGTRPVASPSAAADAPVASPSEAKPRTVPPLRDRQPGALLAQRADSQVERKAESVLESRQVVDSASRTAPVVAAPRPVVAEQPSPPTAGAQQAVAPQVQTQVAAPGFAPGARETPVRLSNDATLARRRSAVAPGIAECYELRGPVSAPIRLLGVPDRIRLVGTAAPDNRSEPGLRATAIGTVVEGTSLSARALSDDAVELVVRRPLDSVIVRITRSAVGTPPALTPAEVASGVKAASARRMVCPE